MKKIAIIGLGYVGLPLAVEFGKYRDVIGFDINKERIAQLEAHEDQTKEVSSDELQRADKLRFTSDISLLSQCQIYIVTVPTPVAHDKTPDLSPLISASRQLGSVIGKGDIVIFESTVYPGATEEVCVPEIEKSSGLIFNKDFFVGYSPERINPGDKTNRLPNIMKITSGSTESIAAEVDELYKEIIVAGTHLAPSIKVAEAAKVIENTQRDLNIALINELAIIFERLNIDTKDVLEAAGTKWNFLPFQPGLVGGHCIGVDPYYLTYKAQAHGYIPDVILSGRRINDGMGAYIAQELMKLMIKQRIDIHKANVLILGFTFKEQCPDTRNTKVIDIYKQLNSEYGVTADIYDPVASVDEVKKEYGIDMCTDLTGNHYDAILVAVGHEAFYANQGEFVKSLLKDESVVFDVKGGLPKHMVDKRL
ncbi:nucleotide sugar dehydrogenase [Pseudoalteromonas sp. GB56]